MGAQYSHDIVTKVPAQELISLLPEQVRQNGSQLYLPVQFFPVGWTKLAQFSSVALWLLNIEDLSDI